TFASLLVIGIGLVGAGHVVGARPVVPRQSPRAQLPGGQTPSAEALFEAGALRAAADSFAARAARAPRDAAHWYNLGATLYRAGADGKATAAWTRAARLAPRDMAIRRARRLLPAPCGGASATATIPAGGALFVGRSYGPWREVSRKDGIHGWVLDEEISGL